MPAPAPAARPAITGRIDEACGRPMDDVTFSWNLLADIQQMWALPFMVNAFRAGTLAALLAAAIGWFMVTRGQAFAGHTLALVGFPGAAGAVLLGLPVTLGYFGFCAPRPW